MTGDDVAGDDVTEIDDCLRQAMAIRGALGASLIDYPSGLTMAAAGSGPSGRDEVTAASTATLVRATVDAAAVATMGQPGHLEDIVVTAGNGYHLVHFPDSGRDRRLVLYMWLDRDTGNLAMTQRSLRAIGARLSVG